MTDVEPPWRPGPARTAREPLPQHESTSWPGGDGRKTPLAEPRGGVDDKGHFLVSEVSGAVSRTGPQHAPTPTGHLAGTPEDATQRGHTGSQLSVPPNTVRDDSSQPRMVVGDGYFRRRAAEVVARPARVYLTSQLQVDDQGLLCAVDEQVANVQVSVADAKRMHGTHNGQDALSHGRDLGRLCRSEPPSKVALLARFETSAIDVAHLRAEAVVGKELRPAHDGGYVTARSDNCAVPCTAHIEIVGLEKAALAASVGVWHFAAAKEIVAPAPVASGHPGPGWGAKIGDQEERSVSWDHYGQHSQAPTEERD